MDSRKSNLSVVNTIERKYLMSQMDLKDFVSETLSQINQGVKYARKNIEGDDGTKIGSRLRTISSGVTSEYLANQSDGGVAHLVHFDVALTVSDTSGSSSKGKISVASIFSAQGDTSEDSTSSEVSRVRFTIPISFEQAPKQEKIDVKWVR